MRLVVMFILSLWSAALLAEEATYQLRSEYGVAETVQRFVGLLTGEGAQILQRTQPNGEGLQDVGRGARHAERVVFTNPLIATYTGRCRWDDRHHQPLKALAWQDRFGRTWLSYSLPAETGNRFGVIECGAAKGDLRQTVSRLAQAATAGEFR